MGLLAMVVLVARAEGGARPLFPERIEQVDFKRHFQPLLAEYCLGCHGPEKKKADVDFSTVLELPRFYENRKLWEKVAEVLTKREMPPDKKPQPHEADRAMLVQLIETGLAQFDCDSAVDPGRVTIRRLNRVEYNNTIRDLFGVDFKPAADFPLDEVGYGFDNIGDVLSLPPMLMEKYLEAAEQITSKAILTEALPPHPTRRLKPPDFKPSNDNVGDNGEGVFAFTREGEAVLSEAFATPGPYRLRIRAWGDQAGPDPARMAVKVGGQEVQVLDVPVTQDRAQTYEIDLAATGASAKELRLGYINNYVVNDHPDPKLRGDRNLYLQWVEIVGPLDGPAPMAPESHRRIIPNPPNPGEERRVAAEILRKFASRAYRRPATASEVERLSKFLDIAKLEGGNFAAGIQLALQAVLTSPYFLFRWELDPGRVQPEGVRSLDGYELASRLSYFLWSSLPDDELFAAAAQGRLNTREELAAQVKRMLADPKAKALAENFGGQWLQIRNLEATPDPDTYPAFDAALRRSMVRETELFFEAMMREDRSLRELISADFSFLNERLARHYGIDGVKGDEFRRVSLPASSHRGGILTHASILTLTSNPTRTSPVNRGKWIMEQLLGTPPPQPPPGVPQLENSEKAITSASLRARLEQHRAKPECATCHNKMDPLGFALENFDGIGAWRQKDGAFDIDPSGVLPDGRAIRGPDELKAILEADDNFIRVFSEKMFTFALGRGLEYYDKCAVDEALRRLKAEDFRFSTLVVAVVQSTPFQKRRYAGNSL